MKSLPKTPQALAKAVLRRDRKALSQGISLLEDNTEEAFELLKILAPKSRGALRIGVTGLPGSGKSTLIDRIANEWLEEGHRVGIILVDPTSPLSGGALLGDRIRLKNIQSHRNVFIRSMATRGRLGGLALASQYAADLMDAAGFDRILIETVGVGQLEVDVASAVHCVLVVLIPGAGDEIQIMKAGLMEIADFFVMNKMDLDKDRIYYSLLERTLEMTYRSSRKPEVKRVHLYPLSTLTREGLKPFLAALEERLRKVRPSERLKRNLLREVRLLVEQRVLADVLEPQRIEKVIRRVLKKDRSASAFKIADAVLKNRR